jgi:fumarate reductase flavoprotein subunit
MTGGHNMNDPALVRYMIENSAGIVDWVTELGFTPEIGETYQSFTVPGYAPGLIIGLQKFFEEMGGKVMLSTKATEIIMKDGAAAGIIAEGADGGKVTINAGAVVIATGGYGANLEWIAELDPSLKGFVTNNHPGATGDGIVMAQAVGAAVRDLNEIQTHPTVHVPTATMMTEGCRNAGGILVNTSGKRFTNEVNYRDIVSEAILSQDQGFAYLIINQEIVDSNGNIQGYYDIGVLQKFDTIADLAKFMNVEESVLQETMDKWNKAVADKNDPEFGSQFTWIRDLSKGPWYSVAVSPGIHHTMGGIVINTNTEVISTDGKVIPGLFACGEVTGGVHGGNRVGGNAILDCLVFGKTAGEKSAAYIK